MKVQQKSRGNSKEPNTNKVFQNVAQNIFQDQKENLNYRNMDKKYMLPEDDENLFNQN